MADKRKAAHTRPERDNANFLRAVLSLDTSDPGLPRYVPPEDETATKTKKRTRHGRPDRSATRRSP